MKFISVGIMSAALAAGLGGSAFAYQLASADSADKSPTSFSASPPRAGAQVVRPGTRFKWAPCPAGSQLEKGVCVTDVVRTIVIPAPAVAQPAAPAPAAQGGVISAAGQGDDDSGYDDDGGEHGDGGDDGEDGDGDDGGNDDD